MLDIKTIRDRTADVIRACQTKGYPVDVDRILELDGRRRELLHASESRRAQRNTLSSQIPKLPNEEKKDAIAKVRDIAEWDPADEKQYGVLALRVREARRKER